MNHSETNPRSAGTGLKPVLSAAAACLLLGFSALAAAHGNWDDDVRLYIGDVGDDTTRGRSRPSTARLANSLATSSPPAAAA